MVWDVFLLLDGGVIRLVSDCTIITTGVISRPFLGKNWYLPMKMGTEKQLLRMRRPGSNFGEGPYRYAGFFNGETYDARLEESYYKFSKPDFKADGLKKPEVITPVVMEEQEGIFPGAACWPAMNEKEPEIVGNYQATGA